MGSFSFICQKSKKNIQDCEPVYLFLLKDGVIIEEQYGLYDTYGNVYNVDENNKVTGFGWKTPWNTISEWHWSRGKSFGIAAIREAVYKGERPTVKSENDPQQGCGRRKIIKVLKNEPYHKILE